MNRYVFEHALVNAAVEAHPGCRPSRYKAVYVLLLSWADDKTGAREAVEKLQNVFRDQYDFRTEEWAIPQHNSTDSLFTKLREFLRVPQDKDMPNESVIAEGKQPPANRDFLRIVYYAGHSHIKQTDGYYWSWSVKSQDIDDKPESPQVDWSIRELKCGQSDADVLILLDCCQSTRTRDVDGDNITEIISGSSWIRNTPGADRYFFTHALNEVLLDLSSGPPFSAAMLHQHVFSRIQKETAHSQSNCKSIPEYKEVDTSKTPTYGALKCRRGRKSIEVANNSAVMRLAAAVYPGNLYESAPEPWRAESLRLKVLVAVTLEEHSVSRTQEKTMQEILSRIPLVWLENAEPILQHVHIPVLRPNAFKFVISMPIGFGNLLPKNSSIVLTEYVDILRSKEKKVLDTEGNDHYKTVVPYWR
ncbi:hypothetical protein MMC17_008807 [Xylographa soralifera]|nr:hypothetical protein [Xylographa soralifera]